ncbi:hypothetical protein [Paramicrobacterium chengjingii]|uniref:Uncharacterized protein n=1 Tax=Paramicrobacterium chengjingii TaxID=2769067 RepID=A0ABX6YE59_9MICO|nr:hypothetical protein [Microbacterium chengjingii]QPZ37041.1 hypothetical protein HCR76_09100 [Microbacterium chengjingii]
MQLGKRWSVGTKVPADLPRVVVSAVGDVEAELRSDGVSFESWAWTLTWLEGRPVVELDDGTVVTYNSAEDTATIRQETDDDGDDDY